MNNPLFWLGLSLFLVALSLTTVLIVTLPAMLALARAARSLEKLADILARELPPTLEAIRLTGIEISELTDDVNDSVQSAGEIVKQVDRSIGNVRQQTKEVKTTTKSIFTGIKVAWKTFNLKPKTKENTRRPLKHSLSSSHKNVAQSHLYKDIPPASATEDSTLDDKP
ncbi:MULTISPECIES: DUF948 domain-containing protein [Okeania]|uniref:DUF948 domain-containing protein n=1 Tax=Okeania hirsuta TaxID=1458930 RepID=A0A3N6NQT1_9CYAN|nr:MULTISPECIES: DUF948 domain-containing protein [Okeania]NEP08009.1 DUF948 domain-containing protein [Okeania sp. SIO4D6]NEP44911.1 DUF948 domain-containing protein [Okeania sp. SIO2H7]NET12204.1 DUF948 domain-containing protein [Okeania sp. SIO1H6]NEP70926.1 DUF948 domain-containing protein [Okeania sp. SIO2G5]NEP92294.1 DUF948 domain-containing protein [Okeania sp. SIO2F5]